jgi:hypothetical protein
VQEVWARCASSRRSARGPRAGALPQPGRPGHERQMDRRRRRGGFGLLVGLITAAGSRGLYVGVRHVQSASSRWAPCCWSSAAAQPAALRREPEGGQPAGAWRAPRAFWRSTRIETPRPGARSLGRASGGLARGVCFAAELGRSASTTSPSTSLPGRRAIAGPTGAGKTTLASPSRLTTAVRPILLDGWTPDYSWPTSGASSPWCSRVGAVLGEHRRGDRHARPGASMREIVAAASPPASTSSSAAAAGYATTVGDAA